MKKASAAQILLVIAACLAPIIGGQINTEATALAPGFGNLFRSILSGFDSIISNFIPSYQAGPSIETPTLSHAIVALLVVAATMLTVGKRQVLQVPFQRVSIPLIAFMVWLVCTLALTSFRSVSLVYVAQWLLYGIAFFTIVASAGRRTGSSWILTAIVIGCTLVAIKGLAEYGSMSVKDPTWRVFSTWANPTSLAGMLSIGLMIALGLAIKIEGTKSVVPWTAALSMACCIMVTDSRGGILSMLAGMMCLGGFIYFWLDRKQSLGGLAKIASVLVLALLFGRVVHMRSTGRHVVPVASIQSDYVLASQVNQPPASPTPVTAQTGQAVEQSSQFRFLLWKGAIKLMKDNPIGYGMGTYRFESARPGLTTETQLTHNTYLQIGVETGILGFVLFVGFIGVWLYEVVRGCFAPVNMHSFLRFAGVVIFSFLLFTLVGILAGVPIFPTTTQKLVGAFGFGVLWIYIELFRKSPQLNPTQNIYRAAIIAGVSCALSHSVLESGLYSFGIGLTTFILMGVGLIQAADGVAPEYIPKTLRAVGGLVAFIAGVALLHAGAVETLRSRARFEFNYANASGFESAQARVALQEANDIIDKALTLAPFGIDEEDGENWRLKANVEDNPLSATQALRKAALCAPNVRNLRSLGVALGMQSDHEGAIRSFNEALEKDPNNLLTLPKLRDAYVAAGHLQKAMETAQRTIDVEKTPYFQVRSLPQLIPVETYEARAWLAEQTTDLSQRAALYEQALAGYESYLQTTIPLILEMAKTDPSVQFGGETLGSAKYKMQVATEIAGRLADTYQRLNKPQDAARVRRQQQRFALAIPNSLA